MDEASSATLLKGRPLMAITRKQFLEATAGSGALLLLQACGGGGYDDPPQRMQCGASGADIGGNHGHALTIPTADLGAVTERTYDITGTAGHAHTVTFTPAQLQELRLGRTVTVMSSTGSGHQHAVTADCP
jgi:hypothetical protein